MCIFIFSTVWRRSCANLSNDGKGRDVPRVDSFNHVVFIISYRRNQKSCEAHRGAADGWARQKSQYRTSGWWRHMIQVMTVKNICQFSTGTGTWPSRNDCNKEEKMYSGISLHQSPETSARANFLTSTKWLLRTDKLPLLAIEPASSHLRQNARAILWARKSSGRAKLKTIATASSLCPLALLRSQVSDVLGSPWPEQAAVNRLLSRL